MAVCCALRPLGALAAQGARIRGADLDDGFEPYRTPKPLIRRQFPAGGLTPEVFTPPRSSTQGRGLHAAGGAQAVPKGAGPQQIAGLPAPPDPGQ
jgi:hypothetical protein